MGSGPGGLEAAKASATLGHKVVLIEKSESIGGQFTIIVKRGGRTVYSNAQSLCYTNAIQRLLVNPEVFENYEVFFSTSNVTIVPDKFRLNDYILDTFNSEKVSVVKAIDSIKFIKDFTVTNLINTQHIVIAAEDQTVICGIQSVIPFKCKAGDLVILEVSANFDPVTNELIGSGEFTTDSYGGSCVIQHNLAAENIISGNDILLLHPTSGNLTVPAIITEYPSVGMTKKYRVNCEIPKDFPLAGIRVLNYAENTNYAIELTFDNPITISEGASTVIPTSFTLDLLLS